MRALLAAALLAAAPAGAVEWVPVGGVTALGGLHTFDGSSGSFTGDVDAAFAPAAKLNERWALLPSARAEYEGTRRLTDALGTDTPIQQSAAFSAGTRAVYGDPASRWRLKPSVAYAVDLLKETRDESWGRGLYDQRRVTVGGEGELIVDDPRAVRAGIEWFRADFPNYTTLESQAALQFQGRSLARELVGDRVLDREGYRFYAAGDEAIGERLIGEERASVVWSRFPNQRVIDEGGQFQEQTREDELIDAAFSAKMPHDWNADLRLLAGAELGVSANASNQNGYDATRGRFLPGFYDFVEVRVVPSATLVIGPVRRPVKATVRVGWRRRTYPHRPPQSGTGAYGSGSLREDEWKVGLGLDYPMAPHLALVFDLERASASSNQDFQAYYRYSYQATTALAGVRWEW